MVLQEEAAMPLNHTKLGGWRDITLHQGCHHFLMLDRGLCHTGQHCKGVLT